MSRISTDDNGAGLIGYLLFKKVVIDAANTISSPITYGMPAPTGFLGCFHAMSRKLALDSALPNVSLGGVLIACYDCQPQRYRATSFSNFTFNQSRNPIKRDGKTASIIEEGKCRLVMSFVVEVYADNDLSHEERQALMAKAKLHLWQQRVAGGSVRELDSFAPVQFFETNSLDEVIPQLLPAFVLMDAQADFAQIIHNLQQDDPSVTPLDALIDIAALHHVPEQQDNGDIKWSTRSQKSGYGWLVPMPMGYQGISEQFAAGVMQNARNPDYPSQYVEAVYGLGKWVFPQRLAQNGGQPLNHAFWRYHYDAQASLYLVTQQPEI